MTVYSFSLLAGLRGPSLRSSGYVVVGGAVLMLRLKRFVIGIIVAIWVVVAMLLWYELMHLLRAGTELIWATISSILH